MVKKTTKIAKIDRRSLNTGQPPIIITAKMIAEIEDMAGLGMSLEEICDLYGFNEKTFRRYQKKDEKLKSAYKRGRMAGLHHVTGSLRSRINAGDTGAICFFLKTQHRWRETQRIELVIEGLVNKLTNPRDVEDLRDITYMLYDYFEANGGKNT